MSTNQKPLHGRRIILQGGYVFDVQHEHAEHLDVLRHRANAYPRLVALAKQARDFLSDSQVAPGKTAEQLLREWSAILRELGEL